jgi:hypothetical protein
MQGRVVVQGEGGISPRWGWRQDEHGPDLRCRGFCNTRRGIWRRVLEIRITPGFGWAACRWSFNLSSLRHCSSLCGVLLNDEVEVLALGYGVSTYLGHKKLVPGAEKARCEGSCYEGVGIFLPRSVEFFINF